MFVLDISNLTIYLENGKSNINSNLNKNNKMKNEYQVVLNTALCESSDCVGGAALGERCTSF